MSPVTTLHDAKVWKSMSHEQRQWVTKLLTQDALAVEVRESFACGWAFDLGAAQAEAERKRFISRIFGA